MKSVRWAMTALLLLSGCAYQGSGVDNPVVRKFTWFSFVEGGDLRAACGPGAADRYRVVYNGVYDEQVRIYELDGHRLRHRVIGDPDLLRGLALADPLDPWRGEGAERVLDPATRDRLVAALADSGAFAAPNVGLELPSRSFYWTAASCHRGEYRFNAWRWPNPDFRRLSLDEALLSLDRTGVPLNPPRAVADRYNDTDYYGDFNLRVGADGLWGNAAF